MKRTPLKRKTELKAKTGIKRQAMKRTPRSKTAARKAQSDTRWRSEAYMKWIMSLPCVVCGGRGGAGHHAINLWNLSGMGLTAPDSFAMPVCDFPVGVCHLDIHRLPELQALQPQWLQSTLELAVAELPDEPELMRALVFVAGRQSSD